jgi:hypothetical protein
MSKASEEVAKILAEHATMGHWANIVEEEEQREMLRAETPRRRATRLKMEAKAKRNLNEAERKWAESNRPPRTAEVRMLRSSFKRLYGRNPTSYIKSRRRRQGRPSRTPSSKSSRSSSSSESKRSKPSPKTRKHWAQHHRPLGELSHRHTKADGHRHRSVLRGEHSHRHTQAQGHRHYPAPRGENSHRHTRAEGHHSQVAKPRPGKFMKQCKQDCEDSGCRRHKTTGDCKFVHRGEPEYEMLRNDQKLKPKGGYLTIPASPPPLSNVHTYTSWPGGIDPSARLYNQASML